MSQIDDLPPLRDVIDRFELRAKKSLGQNFLTDLNLTTKIARSSGSIADNVIVEIGPGPGGLTRALLALGAQKVIAIERDKRCLGALAQIAEHYPGRLEVIEGDALAFDFNRIPPSAKIVANLPYNIATPLLVGWVTGEIWPPKFQSLTLMFQKEVAERICAKRGGKNWGRLGILCNWRCHCQKMFDVPASAFVPPPKVTSSVVHLVPHEHPIEANLSCLEQITKAAFGQRRKMLRSSLKPLGGEALLDIAQIDGTRRAENLDIEDFSALANALETYLHSR